MFQDEWLPNSANPFTSQNMQSVFSNFKVRDLFDHQRREWCKPLLSVLFPREMVQSMKSLYFPLQSQDDCIFWEHSKYGLFTVKSAYLLSFTKKIAEVF